MNRILLKCDLRSSLMLPIGLIFVRCRSCLYQYLVLCCLSLFVIKPAVCPIIHHDGIPRNGFPLTQSTVHKWAKALKQGRTHHTAYTADITALSSFIIGCPAAFLISSLHGQKHALKLYCLMSCRHARAPPHKAPPSLNCNNV